MAFKIPKVILPLWARETIAEFVGTLFYVLMGEASIAQSLLSGQEYGTFLSVNIGFAVGATLGGLTAGGVTGAHMNPAVSMGFAFVGKLPILKMLYYVAAQYLGAFTASTLVLLVYQDMLNAYCKKKYITGENATALIWATYPHPSVTVGVAFADQVVATLVLVFVISAIYDYNNMLIPTPFVPLYVGITILGIGVSFGLNCYYAINPARDFAPRLFSYFIGYDSDVFSNKSYWSLIVIVATHLGGILGAVFYWLFIEYHWPVEELEPEINADEEGMDDTEITDNYQKYELKEHVTNADKEDMDVTGPLSEKMH